MNNAQFMKVINMAWIEYEKTFKLNGWHNYLCLEIQDLALKNKISSWQSECAQAKITKSINGHVTLGMFLVREHNIKRAHRFEAAYHFWEIMVDHYNIFDELLTPHLVVKMLKMEHPQFFKSYH